jgi:hypothetical protein
MSVRSGPASAGACPMQIVVPMQALASSPRVDVMLG